MSRIQFNLLPDVKLQYLRTHRTKNLVMTICIIASVVSLSIMLILLGTVELVQKKQMKDAKTALDNANSQLTNVSDLNKIITIQNQLTTLVTLHQGKHATDRIFGYLEQLTPIKASINKLSLDLKASTLSIAGSADDQKTVNIFVDTLKFTDFTLPGVSDAKGCSANSGKWDNNKNVCTKPAFASVTESSFTISSGRVNYTLDMNFDAKLFANNLTDSQGKPAQPRLSVPSLTSTHSVLDDPSNNNSLFQDQPNSGGKNE